MTRMTWPTIIFRFFVAAVYWWIIAIVAPTGEDMWRFCGFKLCLQHQYIGARRLVAPLYWCIIKISKVYLGPMSRDVHIAVLMG